MIHSYVHYLAECPDYSSNMMKNGRGGTFDVVSDICTRYLRL